MDITLRLTIVIHFKSCSLQRSLVSDSRVDWWERRTINVVKHFLKDSYWCAYGKVERVNDKVAVTKLRVK